MDISTISRVANSKSVQTEFGTFPLKFFFSESLTNELGEDVSSKEIKATLKNIVSEESKTKPLSDDKIVGVLKEKGYTLARRTVAKYREQLGIPVARMRKEL
jgi:RNA polymerase sigma-54 factor